MNRLTTISLLLVLSTGLVQCKKTTGNTGSSSGNGNGYYLRFKLNGTQVEYDSQPFAAISFISSEGLYTAVLAAYKDVNAGLVNAVDITVFSSAPIAINTPYDDPQKSYESNGAWTPRSVIMWYDPAGTAYLTAGSLSDSTGNVLLAGVVADSKLTITELTATDAKGTFSGTVYRTDFQQMESITDGEFYLRKNQ